MKAQALVKQLRLREWGEMVKARLQSGKSVKAYCEEQGIREATYYYRQKQAREAICAQMTLPQPDIAESANNTSAIVSNNWIQVKPADRSTDKSTESSNEKSVAESSIYIEVNGCRIEVTQGADTAQLGNICRMLKTL